MSSCTVIWISPPLNSILGKVCLTAVRDFYERFSGSVPGGWVHGIMFLEGGGTSD